jgi:hypothetical protein
MSDTTNFKLYCILDFFKFHLRQEDMHLSVIRTLNFSPNWSNVFHTLPMSDFCIIPHSGYAHKGLKGVDAISNIPCASVDAISNIPCASLDAISNIPCASLDASIFFSRTIPSSIRHCFRWFDCHLSTPSYRMLPPRLQIWILRVRRQEPACRGLGSVVIPPASVSSLPVRPISTQPDHPFQDAG